MKKLILALLTVLNFGVASTYADPDQPLAERTYPYSENGNNNTIQRILDLYKEESTTSGTPLYNAMEKIKSDNGIGTDGTLNDPTAENVMRLSRGRAMAGVYGLSYLVGIPVTWNGSAMLEEYVAYLLVDESLYLENEQQKISITGFVNIENVETPASE